VRPGRFIMLACVAVLSCAAGSAAGGEAPTIGPKGMLLAGKEGWLWLVRDVPGAEGEEDTFAVAARRAGKEWDMVTGEPIVARGAAAAAIGDQLHVICRRGTYLTFRQDDKGQEGRLRSLESGPLALAAAPGFGPRGKTVLLAVADARVVPGACARFQAGQTTRPAGGTPASGPSTRAASRPAPARGVIGLLVLVYSGTPNSDKPWRPIALLEGVTVAPEGRVMTAVLGRTVYVLVANGPSQANRLMAWTNGQWRQVALTGAAVDARALGMCMVGSRLVLALAEPADRDKAGRSLSLAVFGAGEDDTWEYHPVKGEGDPAPRIWPAQSLPAVTGFGDQSAMLWQDGKTLKLATCSPVGALETPSDVTVFEDAGTEGKARSVYLGVMWGLMVSIFALTFIRRPARPLEPFQLPAGTRPAQMSRRIMAAVVDMLPFSLFATIVFVPNPPETWAELQDFLARRPVPDNLLYSQLLWIALYTAYATVMELRFGRTLGKKLFNLRVVGHAGAKPSPREIVLRNIVRAVPLFWSDVWVLPLLLIIFPLINRNRHRPGGGVRYTS